jgi:DNA-binding transcriptional MerR regulator
MTTDARWTIDELTGLVGQALAVDYSGQRSGRVREVPDRRTIRWYSTIGLLDRPAAMRGRTALYGRRHLLQLVAVKRLQARGQSVAQVQTALLGVDDVTLAGLAQVSADLVELADVHPVSETGVELEPDRSRFWAAAGLPVAAGPVAAVPVEAGPVPVARNSVPGKEEPTLVPSVVLGSGVRLLLDGATRLPDADDLDAISRAANGLLEVLRSRGLAEPANANYEPANNEPANQFSHTSQGEN